MLQPTGQSPQTLGTFWISHGRASKRYCVEVRAPTGQQLDHVAGEGRAVRLVLEGRDHRVGAAVARDQLPVLGDLLGEARAAVAEDAALAVERDRRRDRDRLLERALREGHPRVAGPEAERQVLQRALAALVADRAVERMVDEDELERRVLRLARQLGGRRGLDDHPVGRGEGARRLRLRRARLDLAEAHPAGADRRPEPGLVAEDGDLDAGAERGLDEPGALRHLQLETVDRQRDKLHVRGACVRGAARHWHVSPSHSREREWPATGASTPCSGEEAPNGQPRPVMCA